MVLLVDGEVDVPEALGADDVVQHGGALQVEPPLQRLLAALRLAAVAEVEDDVAGPPQHVFQHGLHLAQRHPAVLLQDDGHCLEHAHRGDDLRQLYCFSWLTSHLHGLHDIEQLEHRRQGALTQGHFLYRPTVTLGGDDKPVVVVVVAPGQQKVVKI